jgi:hypothetical protein
MIYSVIWFPVARISYFDILEYLEIKWTFKEIEYFIERTEQVLKHICNNPLLYLY